MNVIRQAIFTIAPSFPAEDLNNKGTATAPGIAPVGSARASYLFLISKAPLLSEVVNHGKRLSTVITAKPAHKFSIAHALLQKNSGRLLVVSCEREVHEAKASPRAGAVACSKN
jgi:hypothetical protein